MIYWQLFLSFVQVGMFSIGGGYAAMPLIQSQVVEQHAWLKAKKKLQENNNLPPFFSSNSAPTIPKVFAAKMKNITLIPYTNRQIKVNAIRPM